MAIDKTPRGGQLPVPVTLERGDVPETPDEFLYWKIRERSEAVSFQRFERFIDALLCLDSFQTRRKERSAVAEDDSLQSTSSSGTAKQRAARAAREEERERERETETVEQILSGRRYVDRVRGYEVLKEAAELFLMSEAGLAVRGDQDQDWLRQKIEGRIGAQSEVDPLTLGGLASRPSADHLHDMRRQYLTQLGEGHRGLPYIGLILDKLGELPLKPERVVYDSSCYGILHDSVDRPVMIELIWSYWMEQGMLAQTLAALCWRFQNKRSSSKDPLANLELDPLRGVSNLLWGYIQDEQGRLSVQRRAYEYLHEYGLELSGRAVQGLRPADRRSEFLRSFHDLLVTTYAFYQSDDDTTVRADAFPVLNGLQNLHMVLAEGAHNQFGDLSWTARVEMLVQQWILARPELREFLGGRIMVPYREPWMDRVDAMRQVQGWGGPSITHFRDLATYAEMLLLSVRWASWSTVLDPDSAANWARLWRPEVQMYIHAYRAVTGVDLRGETTSTQGMQDRYVQPAHYLELAAASASRNGNGRKTAPTLRAGH